MEGLELTIRETQVEPSGDIIGNFVCDTGEADL